MGPLLGETELPEALLQAGKDLLNPLPSTQAILDLLNKVESLLSAVDQDPIVQVQNALKPSMQALVSADLLRNPDSDVRVYVVSCLTEIMRITAPEAPYNDDHMKEVFEVTVEAFGKLADASCESYKKAEAVLDTVAKVRSSLVMLDLECDDLILEMFRQFLKVIRLSPDSPQAVLRSMETIMITVIDESEEVSMDLLEIILGVVRKESLDVSPVALRLVEKVLISCACKLRPVIMEALKSTRTSLDMYSPVVSSICQSEAATAESHIVVNTKQIDADEKISDEQVVSKDSLQDQGTLVLRLPLKGTRSKRTARGGTGVNGDDKVRNEDDLKPKHGLFESTEAEAEPGSTRRRGRRPNSLMNPEEGYSFKPSSSKKVQEKKLGDLSHGKPAAKKTSLPSKVGQTNQSVVISLSPSSRARNGSRKRSRSKMEETNLDAGSLATTSSKKQIVKKGVPEEEDMESELEKPEDSIKTAKSSKKESAQKGSVKTAAKNAESKTERAEKGLTKTAAKNADSKKEIAQNGSAKTSAKKSLKKSVHSDAKKTNSKGARTDTQSPQSSKSKKKNPRAVTPPAKESEQTLKSHPKRKRTAREEVESNKSELGEELVGKRVKVWWPLDEEFYDGVIKSYCSREKIHQVSYSDGDAEELNLKEERWEIIQDNPSSSENVKQEQDIDLPDSTPLCDIMRRQKAKKRKHVSMDVELKSSSDVRSSKKQEPLTNSINEGKRTKGALKSLSSEPESREVRNLKSSKEPNAETGRTKVKSGKRQKVTQAMHRESEKDCDDKEESETKGEDSLKESNAEPECNHQELSEDLTSETKIDGEELKSTNKSTAEGEEQEVAKEPSAEPKTDREERESVKERIEEPQTEVQLRESATADTKLIEDMSKGTSKVGKEAEEEDDQRIVKEVEEEETDKAEVGTIPVSG